MSEEEKKFLAAVSLIAVFVVMLMVIGVGKSEQAAEFRKKQIKKSSGRLSAIRKSLKKSGAKPSREGQRELASPPSAE